MAGGIRVVQRSEPSLELAGRAITLTDVLHEPGCHLELVDGPDHGEAVPLGHVEPIGVAEVCVLSLGVPADEVLGCGDGEVGFGLAEGEAFEVDEDDLAVRLADEVLLVSVAVDSRTGQGEGEADVVAA